MTFWLHFNVWRIYIDNYFSFLMLIIGVLSLFFPLLLFHWFFFFQNWLCFLIIFGLSYFSSFLWSKCTSLMFFNTCFIKQVLETIFFLLSTVLATLHKFGYVKLHCTSLDMLSFIKFQYKCFFLFSLWLLLWPKCCRSMLLNFKYLWLPRYANFIGF